MTEAQKSNIGDMAQTITFSKDHIVTLVAIGKSAQLAERKEQDDIYKLTSILCLYLKKNNQGVPMKYDPQALKNGMLDIMTEETPVDHDDDKKIFAALNRRVIRAVQVALVLHHSPIHKVVKVDTKLKNKAGKTIQRSELHQPNYLNFPDGMMKVPDTDNPGKTKEVIAKTDPLGQAMVRVSDAQRETIFRQLKSEDGKVLYPSNRKSKPDPEKPVEQSFGTKCAAIKGVCQDVATGKKVIGHDGNDIDPEAWKAIDAIFTEYERACQKMIELNGKDWRNSVLVRKSGS